MSQSYTNFKSAKEQKMTAEKEAELKSLFNSYDDNGDNCISPGELKQAFLKLGQEITDEEIEDMMKQADLDRSGKIDWEEFLKMMKKSL